MSSMTQNLREVMKVMFKVPGFDRVLEKVTLVSAAPEKLICEMKVEEQHTNKLGTLHGGLTATLVDSISTMALMCTERGAPGVSVDMNITYMSPAKIGEEIVITAHILKQGKTLAFASVDLTNKTTGSPSGCGDVRSGHSGRRFPLCSPGWNAVRSDHHWCSPSLISWWSL